MERIFLDANVLFSAAYRPDAGLLKLWKLKDVVLCSSRYAFEEARINLHAPEQHERLDRLGRALHFFDSFAVELPALVSLPEKDVPILLAAIEAEADYLLTGDVRHFGPYFGKNIRGVTILLPSSYFKLKNT